METRAESIDAPTRTATLDGGRPLALDLFDAAVAAAAPAPLVERAVDALGLGRGRRVWLFAIGKAATAMATGACAALHRGLHEVRGGVIVAADPAPPPDGTLVSTIGDHPAPGRNSYTAAALLGESARGRTSGDVALVLVSGGASSLIAAPARGIGETELSQVNEQLLRSGLGIADVNAIRKRFTRWGGGRLALALAPAQTHCLVISDVVGDDPSDVGSGPCVPDKRTVGDVLALLDRQRMFGALPATARDLLLSMVRGVVPDTPRPTHPAFAHVSTRVIAGNRTATDAAAEAARTRGASRVEIVPTPLVGDAATMGGLIARELVAARGEMASGTGRLVRLWGGETTVSIPMGDHKHPVRVGRGGRSQELALAAARALADAGDDATGITILAAGTDGRDGPTDAAGACVDARTWGTIAARGVDPAAALAHHDAYGALDAVGALVRTGATGTNVGDVVIGIVA